MLKWISKLKGLDSQEIASASVADTRKQVPMLNTQLQIDTKLPQLHVFSAGTLSPLTRSKLTEILRHLLSQAGMYPSNYASHSFRIGAATIAAAAGFPTWLIKTLRRWSSNAYLTYVRCPNSVIASVPKTLSSATVTDQPIWNPDK